MKPYYDHAGITIYQGHVLSVLPSLSKELVQCVVTSPPYWGLRDYGLPPQVWDDPGGCEHEWAIKQIKWHSGTNAGEKQKTVKGAFHNDHIANSAFCQLCGAWRGSLGLEPTPELYIQHIVQVFREVKRVLRKDGTLWLNLGDSYNSSPGGFARSHGKSGWHPSEAAITGKRNVPGLKPKDLCGIPWRVALALQADGWWLRSDIIWAKPNPMPESVTDRPTRAHEYVFLLTKSAKYFYDADAVREAHSEHSLKHNPGALKRTGKDFPKMGATGERNKGYTTGFNPQGRNLRSVWTIATEPTPEAHFATFPEKLVIPCIKAGTSEKGCCPECGAPWVRVVETKYYGSNTRKNNRQGIDENVCPSYPPSEGYEAPKTIGWKPSCECSKIAISGMDILNPIPCTVLDPFLGSGKVLVVAQKFGRKGIGSELNPEYCKMPLKKIAQNRMF